MIENKDIPLPDGISVFDPERNGPARLGLKSLFYGIDTRKESFGQPNTSKVRAVYEPGGVLVTFQNGTGKFDVDDKAALPERLNEVGVLMTRFINTAQQIQTRKEILELSSDFRKSLAVTAGLPDSHVPTVNLEACSTHVAEVLDDFHELAGNDVFLKALEQEKRTVSEKLKELGVSGVNYKVIQRMSSFPDMLSEV